MKTTRKFKIAIAFLALFAVWIMIAPFLAKNLIVDKPLEKADAIWVLSGGSTFIERTHKAAELFKNGVAPKIFLTNDGEQGGWNQTEKRNPYFYEKARWELIAQGVPDGAIEVLPEVVESTQDEAILFAKNAPQKNLKTVLLVTSGYHTRRALSAFETVLHKTSDSIEIGIVSPEVLKPSPYYWWLSPKGWQFVAGEYLKIVYYWVYY
ncbi:hypothetical protein BH10ACI1_BH10ACI1_16400 [soil metagenome]